MAQANFSLDNFKSEVISRAGLARTNRFEVLINAQFLAGGGRGTSGGDSNLVSLYVEQASIPLLNIATKPFKIFGPSFQRPVTSEYGGEGISMTFHVDREMKVRKFFENWMHRIINQTNYTVAFQSEYATTINIRQLDDKNNVTHEVQLLEAFPRNLNLMELNNASSNQTHRLNVLFAYRYWKDISTTFTVPDAIPRPIATPQVPRTSELNVPVFRNQWNWSTGTLENNSGSDLPPSA